MILSLPALVSGAMAYPDLEAGAIEFSNPLPEAEEIVSITATIKNSGESYSEPFIIHEDGEIYGYAAIYADAWRAQSFYFKNNINFAGVKLFISNSGNSDLTVNIQESDFSGADPVPSGISLATSTVNIPKSGLRWRDIPFPEHIKLTEGTTYWIVAKSTAANSPIGEDFDGYGWAADSSGAFEQGRPATSEDQGNSWSVSYTNDLTFMVYGATETTVEFFRGNPSNDGILISSTTIGPVPGGGQKQVHTQWDTDGVPAGYYDIFLRVNDGKSIIEDNYNNNISSRTIALDCPRITDAWTIDSALDGVVDGIAIEFNKAVDTSAFNPNGLLIGAFDNRSITYVSPDKTLIEISFSNQSQDTGITPELEYIEDTGGLTGLEPDPIPLAGYGSLSVRDGASPVIYEAVASGNEPGIQAGDEVILTFSEAVSPPPLITNENIDSVLTPPVGTTWTDGDGFIGSAVWGAANTRLTITLSASGGAPTIDTGFEILVDSFTFTDAAGNSSSHTFVLEGDFGVDLSTPAIISRTTMDRSSNGYIDAVRLRFDKNMNAGKTDPEKITIAGGEVDITDAEADVMNPKIIYIYFTDGIMKTGRTPMLECEAGAFTDTSGRSTGFSAEACTDGAPPAVLSAIASDGGIPRPGPDDGDYVVITFSEPTNRPTVDSSNIDLVFVPEGGLSWGEAYGEWNESGEVITVYFTDTSSTTLYAEYGTDGSRVSISSVPVAITDTLGNTAVSEFILSGSFTPDDREPPELVSLTPLDGAAGIETGTPISMGFNKRMSIGKTREAVSVYPVRDNRNRVLEGAEPLDLDFSESYDTVSGLHTFTFTPEEILKNNYSYRVEISSEASDTLLNSFAGSESVFTTILDPADSNRVSGAGGTVNVDIPENAARDKFFIIISTEIPQAALSAAARAGEKHGFGRDPYSLIIETSLVEIKAYGSGNKSVERFEKPLTLSFSSPEGEEERAHTLEIYRLDTANSLWTRVQPLSRDPVSKTLSAETDRLSVFSIGVTGSGDLSRAYAFPVPYIEGRDSSITFTQITPGCLIRIYSPDGKLVKRIRNDGGEQAVWDNIDAGSGVYLYHIENETDSTRGKLIIIR